jgi:hypothetical protein
LKKEYLRRLRLILGTELSAKNKIQTTRSQAVPVLRYSFGSIKLAPRRTAKTGKENIESATHCWTGIKKIWKQSTDSLQKTAILRTARVTREVLQYET